MSAAASAFSQGWANGARGRSMRREDERADRRLQMDEERHRAEMANPDLDAAVQAKRKQILEGELNLELEMKRRGLENFVASDAAFNQFEAGLQQIDWGTPDAGTQYEMLTRQYLPKILRDSRVLQKWEALDRVTKQGRAFANRKSLEAMTLSAMEEAAQLAPDLALDPPKNPDGTINLTEFGERLRERRKESYEQDFNLRRASAARTAKPSMGPGAKAELDAVADELRDINRRLLEPKLTPDQKLPLVNRKATLLRQLRAFDHRFEEPSGDPSAPGDDTPAGNAAPTAPTAPARRRWNPETGVLE